MNFDYNFGLVKLLHVFVNTDFVMHFGNWLYFYAIMYFLVLIPPESGLHYSCVILDPCVKYCILDLLVL